jgi:hypothetical protein
VRAAFIHGVGIEGSGADGTDAADVDEGEGARGGLVGCARDVLAPAMLPATKRIAR